MQDELNRHLAAVMFTDMAGYTALMQKDEAAALRSRQRHRNALEQSLQGRSGEVLQYFGDGSLSIFSSSVQAVEAAIDIQRYLKGDPTLRIGLHSGDIAYDIQGAYGDAVNIAARLEAICPPGGVTISQKIYDDIRRHPQLSVVPIGSVRLKHIDQSVPTYALAVDGLSFPEDETDEEHPDPAAGVDVPLAVLERVEELSRRRLDPLQGVATVPGRVPLVGRDREVEAIRRAMEEAEHRQSSAIIFRGPRGVGKTRLTQEVSGFARERGWIVLNGRAHPSERLVPYAPFADALMPLLRGLDLETLAALTPGSGAALCSLFPALGAAPRSRSLDLGPAAPGDTRTQLYWQFAGMLAKLASHRPVLLTLEDLDFADRASLDLLEFIARQTRGERIVFVGEYTGTNPERKQALLSLEQSLISDGVGRVFELAALDQAGSSEFIKLAFDMDEGEIADLAEVVFNWSQGNPFFMTGTLRGLVEGGALRNEDGRWTAADLDSIELPHSVRDAVLVWMGQLGDHALELARTLAVVGRQVSYELIRHLTGMGDSELGRTLDELVRHQLVQEAESQWTLMYAFRNPLIRETLRAELALSARRELHTFIAQALEAYYGDTKDEHADELAYHYGRAHPGTSGAKSIRYLTVAGEAALRRYADREAAAYFQEALERLDAAPPGAPMGEGDAEPPRLRVLKGLARGRRRLGDATGSVAIWRRLQAEAQAAGDPIAVTALHREIGLTHMSGGKFEEAVEHFAAATEWASGAANVPLVVRSQLAEAMCYQNTGQAERAAEAVENSLLLAKEFGDPRLLGQVHRSRIQQYTWTGQIDEARDAAKRAIELCGQTGDRGVEFWSRLGLSALEGLIGNTQAMAENLDVTERVADEIGSPLHDLWIQELRVELATALGDWEEGIAMGTRAIERARSMEQRLVLPRLLVWVSGMHLGRGEREIAEELTREAWEVSGADRAERHTSFVDLHAVVPAHIGRAWCSLARGDWNEAVRIADAGLRIADRSGYIVWAFHYLMPIIAEASIHARDLERASSIGRRMREEAERLGHPLGLAWADACDSLLTWLQNDAAAGAKSLREGAEALESIPIVYEAARLRRQLAGRLAEVGESKAALEELHRAYEVFERLGAEPELEKARGQFVELGVDVPASG